MTLKFLSLSRLPDLSSERRFSFFPKPSIICLPTLSPRPLFLFDSNYLQICNLLESIDFYFLQIAYI